ncbi:hypothetical protein EV121DRAFT_217702 [Schizophyllum commune]
MSSQQHRRYEPPLLNSQQHGKSYAHRALERPSLDHHSLHHQPSRPSSGSLATPSASHQGYPLVELSHPYTPAQGRPYTTTPYTALAERSITARAYQRSQPAFPSPQDRIPRAWDNSRLTAPITSTSIPRMPVSSAIATPTAQSTPGVYRPFTPQLNIALDPRQMRLVAPCANLDRDVICSVGRVLAPGSVHVTADGRWTIAQLAQVVCRCASDASFGGPAKMIPDEPSRPAAIPRHEVYHMVAAELVHEPTYIVDQACRVSAGPCARRMPMCL